MSKYIYSTKTASTAFVLYKKGANDMPIEVGRIFIQGGAGIATKTLVTPRGVVTEVSDKDFALLEQNKVFQRQVAAGWLKVGDKKKDPEKEADNLEAGDKSKPITTKDLEKEGLDVDTDGKETVVTPKKSKKKGK